MTVESERQIEYFIFLLFLSFIAYLSRIQLREKAVKDWQINRLFPTAYVLISFTVQDATTAAATTHAAAALLLFTIDITWHQKLTGQQSQQL